MNWMQVEKYLQNDDRAILPLGSTEQHSHLRLTVDCILPERVAVDAAEPLGIPVFPVVPYGVTPYFREFPGSISLRVETHLRVVGDILDGMAHSGFRRILIVNGHGGNNSMLPFFAQSQLASPRDYMVYVYGLPTPHAGRPAMTDKLDMHAGQSETAHTMISRPDLVHPDRAGSESGADRHRLKLPPNVYTGIWWYARFPDHYSGDGSLAYKALGEFDAKAWIADVVEAIRAVKADEEGPRLQHEFFEKTRRPLDTKQ